MTDLLWPLWFRHKVIGILSAISFRKAKNTLQLAAAINSPAGLELLYKLDGEERASRVNIVAWSPDGRLLVSGYMDGTIRLWNTGTRSLLWNLKGHTGAVNVLAWSPNGRRLISGSSDKILRMWNPLTGALLYTLRGHTGSVNTAAWSPDGKRLASGSDDGTIRLWDTMNRLPLRILEGHTGSVNTVVWSPDGGLLASGSDDKIIWLWGPVTGLQLRALKGHTGAVNVVSWSSKEHCLASGSTDGTIRLWNPISGAHIHTLEGHSRGIDCLDWSPDSGLLASNSAASDPSTCEVRFWCTHTWEPIAVLTELKESVSAIWHPSLPLLVTSGQKEEDIFVWSLDFEQLLQTVSSQEVVHYANAKVVLVGDSGTGKSGLALVLTDQPFVPTESTHARHVWQMDQPDTRTDGRPHERREILLWDLAGQPDYRLIHQLHLHEATIALIVFDATRDTDPFASIRYWHQAIHRAHEAHGSGTPQPAIFLVAARIDRGGRNVSRARIDEVVQELGCSGYIETSAKDGRGVARLRQTIRSSIDWTQLPKVTTTSLLQAIKTFVQNTRETGRVLRTFDDLYDAFLHEDAAPTDSSELRHQFKTALGRLEAQGSIRDLGFGNLILLRPERLDAYATALLIAVKSEPEGLGAISEVRVQQGNFPVPQEDRLRDSAQEKLLLIAIIDELVRQQIALREGGFLLFPSQSIREHPDMAALSVRQTVIFSFASPALSLYTTLVVRLARSDVFQKQEIWHHVVTYTPARLGGTHGIMLSLKSDGQAELGLFFDRDARQETRLLFESFIQLYLERNISGRVQRTRRFACLDCGKVFSEADVSFRQSRGFTFIRCICDNEVPLLEGEQLLTGSSIVRIREMEQAADAQRDRESFATLCQGKVVAQAMSNWQSPSSEKTTRLINIYLSSASMTRDEGLLQELEKQLSVLRRQANVCLRNKRHILAGEDRQQEIATYLNQADLILFLISPDLLDSDECYAEMQIAIERKSAGKAQVIPILLRYSAGWRDSPIGKFEPLPIDQKPIADRPDWEKTMRDVAEYLQQMIEKMRQVSPVV
jgi:small GTP-binding protein